MDDQLARVVAQLPQSARVGTYATAESTQSIGNALEFALSAQGALADRAKPGAPQAGPAQVSAARATLESFVVGVH
jgi:hypothetical protein